MSDGRQIFHYSGDKSREFWERVHTSGDQTLYLLGCALQDIERRVLFALENAELRKKLAEAK